MDQISAFKKRLEEKFVRSKEGSDGLTEREGFLITLAGLVYEDTLVVKSARIEETKEVLEGFNQKLEVALNYKPNRG